MAPKRNLLLCFDAFGTLFAPKSPISHQYGEVARSLGLGGFTDDDLVRSFKTAYKEEVQQHPNFGKAAGMNPQKWWTNIITNTFQPLVGQDRVLPSELVPRLLHRFWSEEGYTLLPGVREVFDRLRVLRQQTASDQRIVVGVVTNSDNRVPDVLSSLGLSVNGVTYQHAAGNHSPPAVFARSCDIDFVVMSFDVGHEKPHASMFRAAEELLRQELCAEDGDGSVSTELTTWERVYVGDEYDKDVHGARSAGWDAILVGPKDERVKWLDEQPDADMTETLDSYSALGIGSLEKLIGWLK